MKTEATIVVVGDAKVGKTSLITTLLSEQFQEKVVPVVPTVTIPPEATPDRVTTHVIDTSSHEGRWSSVESDIRRADSICIVYSHDNPATFERISSYWLPTIRNIRENKPVPVVLVGNKIDLKGNTSSFNLESQMSPIMSQFKEVETCVECSAKKVMNVQEAFYFAQKAVIYPTGILFDTLENRLTPGCCEALSRIFYLCDEDKDNALSDQELLNFQEKCFGISLSPEEIRTIKECVVVEGGINENGITMTGFFYLNHLFIEKGKLETTWKVLRSFHYNDELTLEEDYVNPRLDVEKQEIVELNELGYKFLADLFKSADRDNDGALSPSELERLFITANSMPKLWNSLKSHTVTIRDNHLTLEGFLSMWSLTTALEYKETLQFLAKLGYEHPTTNALTVNRGIRDDIEKHHITRNVFQCLVFGAKDTGKTTLLNNFIRRDSDEKSSSTADVVRSVLINNDEKYLIMKEIIEIAEQATIQAEKTMSKCDLVVFLYDLTNPKTFDHVASIHEKLTQKYKYLSYVFLGTKSDQATQRLDQKGEPEKYCEKHKIAPPKYVSLKEKMGDTSKEGSDIYGYLVHQMTTKYESSYMWPVVGGSVLVAALAIGAFLYMRTRK